MGSADSILIILQLSSCETKVIKNEEKRAAEEDAAKAAQKKIEWGSQIRNYVLYPYQLVKDVRTNVEKTDSDSVLDGDLDDFMLASLQQA